MVRIVSSKPFQQILNTLLDKVNKSAIIGRMKRSPDIPTIQFLRDRMREKGLSQYKLAKQTGQSTSKICYVFKGRHGITPTMAIKLGEALDVDPEHILNLQTKDILAMINEEQQEGGGSIEERTQEKEEGNDVLSPEVACSSGS